MEFFDASFAPLGEYGQDKEYLDTVYWLISTFFLSENADRLKETSGITNALPSELSAFLQRFSGFSSPNAFDGLWIDFSASFNERGKLENLRENRGEQIVEIIEEVGFNADTATLLGSTLVSSGIVLLGRKLIDLAESIKNGVTTAADVAADFVKILAETLFNGLGIVTDGLVGLGDFLVDSAQGATLQTYTSWKDWGNSLLRTFEPGEPVPVAIGSVAGSSPAIVFDPEVAVSEKLSSNAPGSQFVITDPGTTVEIAGGGNVVWSRAGELDGLRIVHGPEAQLRTQTSAPASPVDPNQSPVAFTQTDALFVHGATFDDDDVGRGKGSAILQIDFDQDGNSDATVTMEGDYRLSSFVTEAAEDGTYVRYLGNAVPMADTESFEVAEDGTLTVAATTLLEGDTDADGDVLAVAGVSNEQNGTVSLDDKADGDPANDEVIFTPTPGFSGAASFDYTVADGFGGKDTVTVTVTVSAAPNQAPAVSAITAGFGEDQTGRTVNLLDPAFVSDPDGDDLDVENFTVTTADGRVLSATTDPETGLFSLDDGQFDDLAEGALFEVSIGYDVTDGVVSVANTAVVTITGANDNTTSSDDGETVVGTEAAEVLDALGGDDLVDSRGGGDTVTLGSGADALFGDPMSIFGDTVTDFSEEDRMIFEGVEFARSDVTIDGDPVVISVDTDQYGTANGSLTVLGDFSPGDFMAVALAGDTTITFETFLPALQERQAVEPNLVNGIINQAFLSGDGASDFQVTLRDLGFAGYKNVLGVYEIDAGGNIVDTRILFDNANANKSSVAGIAAVEAGNRLGFFIVQDAADWASTLADSDVLSFVNDTGAAANLSDGSAISIAVNGLAVDEMVFHSFSEHMNSDGVQHALSGVDLGGEAITVGFEDLTGGGDRDYEDVMFRVELVDDLMFV